MLWFSEKSLIKDAPRGERNFLTQVFQIKLKKGASSVRRITGIDTGSIAEKCFDVWGILEKATVKSVEPGDNSFNINHIIRCRSKPLLLEFSKFVLVLIL